MGSFKLPVSLNSRHGGKFVLPFPISRSFSPFITGTRDHRGFIIQTLALVGPRRLSYRGSHAKRSQHFTARASAQPLTEELVEDKNSDLSTSGDSIRRRFLEFYAARGHKVLPSASLVPEDPTVLLTIAGMLQFKPIFLGKVPREVPRAATSQRCIRTNDVENVGRTSRHQTFFEMLGNFSFGDYFKQDAIKWAWELATVEFGLPADRLWISVYDDDDETFSIWHNELGVPAHRIKRLGEEDNFWTSGVTGPCGPCSEIYYDFHPEKGYSDVDLGDDARFIEFYNLVFMQYNRNEDGSLEPLKQKNIDTGLGLERMARILQQVPNNYETDLIFPIIEKASNLAKVSYQLADESTKTNLKIIGDHMRAIVYLISDGVFPSNIGRGYVVRRLIRRAVRTGRLLGIKGDGIGNSEGAFLPILAEDVIKLSTNIDPDVKTRGSRILDELKREELRFVLTLERGEKLLEQMLIDALSNAQENGTVPCLSGKDAFLLYDTYGFPVEITKEVADERGVGIDMDSFDIEMENQRRQSQAAHNTVKLSVENGAELTENIPDTEFLGYSTLSTKAVVEGLLVNGKPVRQVSEGNEVEVLLDRTPFYAESGGQIGDHGFLYVTESGNHKEAVVEVKDVQKSLGNIFVHKGTVKEGVIDVGREVEAAVDANLRQRAKVHHTATHLLQAALKKVIGQETSQAGSLVAFDRLRFDFNFNRSLRENELVEIERLINQWIGDATLLETKVMPLTDAKKAGAIAMFGEKYGEQVRVVEVPGVSMELCGGTHVSNTSEIRGFKIISEQGIASGIRRIEAVAGEAFIEYVITRDNHLKQLCSSLKVNAEDVTTRVNNLLKDLREARSEVSAARAKAAIYKASTIISKAFTVGSSSKIRVVVESMDDIDGDALKSAAEYLVDTLQDPAAVVLGSCPDDKRVCLIAAFTPGVVNLGIQAGKFIGPIAKLCGGKGGGRPNLAQAGGSEPEKLVVALEKARDELMSLVSEKAGAGLHGIEWHFKHIFRGQPRRHLLTTGWSTFVTSKRLVAGDSFVFLRGESGELRVGVRRHAHQQSSMPSSVISSQSMHLGVLATASHAVLTRTLFVVYYKPRTSQFIIGLNKYLEAVSRKFGVGMRFTMRFEGEDSPERRFSGTIVGVEDISPHWEDSKWRSLKVQWDEPASIPRPERVSPWEIEPFSVSVPTSLVQPPTMKHKRPRPRVEIPVSEAGWQSSPRVNASPNLIADETEENRSASALSVISNQSAPNSAKLSNSPVPCQKESKSDTVATCRLFGVDLNSPSLVPPHENASLKPADAPQDAEVYIPSVLLSGDLEQKSSVSRDSKEPPKKGQLQVPTKDVQSRQSHSTRSRTKVQMHGVAVGRAVDLTTLNGYDELITELEEMFEIKGELRPRNKWEIVFTDDEGDTMLVGDDPWPEFCNMVRRIFICSNQDVKKMKGSKLPLPSAECED